MITSSTVPLDALTSAMTRGELFAVLDACDAPSVPLLCEGLGAEKAVSLYRGEAEESMADIAPYLVHVDTPELLQWILDFAKTDEGWGIFVQAPVALDVLRTHLRKFLKVLGPDGKRLYFRFYDPRVLAIFLPTCDEGQEVEFFGPIVSFGVLDKATHGHGAASLSLAQQLSRLSGREWKSTHAKYSNG